MAKKNKVQKKEYNQEEDDGFERMQVYFGPNKDTHNTRKASNRVRTSKYTILTWAPLSLLFQFTRAANIYFLIISILTCMPFSPKAPASMIGTFAGVLIFTMFKELFEDYYRMKGDREINNSTAMILNYEKGQFESTCWKNIRQGDVVKISKDETFAADILFMYAKTDVIFVDTMNLDGETNLKPKVMSSKQMLEQVTTGEIDQDNKDHFADASIEKLQQLSGHISCEMPNENLEKWDANLILDEGIKDPQNLKIGSLLLRGCYLKNIEYAYGIVVYLGKETKIMKNAKKPPRKVSNLMKMMNYMLYTVFIFQISIITVFATISVIWINNQGNNYTYLDIGGENAGFGKWVIQLLTYWVAYSHMIPISLYVIIEVLKLVQSSLVKWDNYMYDPETEKRAECRNSDLVEELGQVDFIFSDKTGTLTCNKMLFKKCSVGGKVYGTDDEARNIDFEEDKSNFEANMDKSSSNIIHSFYESGHKSDKLKTSTDKSSDLKEFFRFMALCHSVMVDHDPKTMELNYQASSPDELALVKASKEMGFELTERTKDGLEINENGTKIEYTILAEFPFNSDRKRMSVIIESQGSYALYCKGADSIMTSRISWKEGEKSKTFDDLEKFAIEGLRTLVMAKKDITQAEYKAFADRQRYLETSSFKDKEDQLFNLYSEYETELEFIGASAIEDKLQNNVPETISKLMSANIRLWVLTGDKQETAIEIAKSCQLIQEGMEVIILTQSIDDDSQMKEYLNYLIDQIENAKRSYGIGNNDASNGYKNVQSLNSLSIVIDGPTLELVLGNAEIEEKFFSFALYARSVVCCRVSPKQKASIVKLSKYKKGSISLSVGDGANDVPMIMEANVGVGIRGKEGTQAVRSADYAISQFEFLQRLLLIHGRLGYRRVSWVI